MAGIDSTGNVSKSLLEIETDMNNLILSIMGADTNLNSTTPEGSLRDVFSDAVRQIWEVEEDSYTARTILASSTNLDIVAALTGKKRLTATYAIISDFLITISGTVNLTAGDTFSQDGNSDIKFALNEDFSETVAGDYRVSVTATTAGELNVNTNTITVIDSPVANLDAVANDGSAVFSDGRDQEADAELRARIQAEPTTSSTGTDSAIRKAILDLNDETGAVLIQNAFVIENDNLTTDVDGREGKSIEVVVYQAGGATDRDDEIAAAIAASKADGIKTVSTTGSSVVTVVTLDSGNTRTVTFSRPSAAPIYLTVNTTPTLTATQITDLEETIVEWGEDLGVGQDVVVFGSNSLTNVLNTWAGATLTDYQISISLTDPPAAPNPGTTDGNITIDYTEISTWDTDDITIGTI
jgi:hypothetical protein